MTSGAYGEVFSDILLLADVEQSSSQTASVLSGGSSLPSQMLIDSGDSYAGASSVDVSKRSAGLLGDVNDDGIGDLIIGDPYVAKCYVMFGSQNGLINMTKGFTIFGESEGDLAGWSVSAAGDVNNDTIADILIGAPTAREVGAFYVIYGRRSNNFDVYLNNLTASQGFVVYGSQKSDYLGISLSGAGDVNGDRCDDIIVGGVMTSLFNAGAAFIVYGCSSLRSVNTISQLSPTQGYKLTCASYSYCGGSVTGSGDVNKDGLADVLIGSFPQRSTLIPTAYLVYGSKTASAEVLLSELASPQGVRILGGGDLVSYLGDGNQDGFADIMIESSRSSDVNAAGTVVYTTLQYLTRLSASPSTLPSFLPVFVPTLAPSRAPSRVPVCPSIGPTRVPSVLPTVRPSIPTRDPSLGTAMPSSPTVEPSVEPSEHPTVLPTEMPSESPTLHPTESPSEAPTSQSPTVLPTDLPTSQSPSARPTVIELTRDPFSAPTRQPSVPITATPTLGGYNVYFIQGGSSVTNQTLGYQNYIVNTSEAVFIYNSMGHNKYTLYPHPNSLLTIAYLNNSIDLIDITAFKSIVSFEDLVITEGSVILTLPSAQVVRILNLKPDDMKASNFVFYSDVATGKKDSTQSTLSVVTGCLIALAGAVLGTMLLLRLVRMIRWSQTAAHVISKKEFLMVVKYNKDGEVITENEDDEVFQGTRHDLERNNSGARYADGEEDEEAVRNFVVEMSDSEASSVNSSKPSIVSSGDNSVAQWSDRTLNSEGEWVPKIQSRRSSSLLSEFSINSEGDFVDRMV